MVRFAFATVCCSMAFLTLVSHVAAQNQKVEDRLEGLLKQFPDADTNQDGVLTREEAQAYRQKAQADRDGKKANPKKGQPAELPKPTHADVKYGPADRNVLDFYQAKSDKPTPLIINIHGG